MLEIVGLSSRCCIHRTRCGSCASASLEKPCLTRQRLRLGWPSRYVLKMRASDPSSRVTMTHRNPLKSAHAADNTLQPLLTTDEDGKPIDEPYNMPRQVGPGRCRCQPTHGRLGVVSREPIQSKANSGLDYFVLAGRFVHGKTRLRRIVPCGCACMCEGELRFSLCKRARPWLWPASLSPARAVVRTLHGYSTGSWQALPPTFLQNANIGTRRRRQSSTSPIQLCGFLCDRCIRLSRTCV